MNFRRLQSYKPSTRSGLVRIPHLRTKTGLRHTVKVISGHRNKSRPGLLYPQKRTSELGRGMSALCQKQTKCIAATATSFNHVICSDEHCFASRPCRVYLLTANHPAKRQCERQQRHHHSERDPPVRYQPFILQFLLQARPRLFGRTRTIRAPIPPADWSLGQYLDMVLAGLRTVHDNCKLLEEQGGNIHVS
jgi:hypothetical protein